MGVLVLLKSLVRTLRENSSVWIVMSGLFNRTVRLCYKPVVALMVTDVVVVAVGCSVGVAVGKGVLECSAGCVQEFVHIVDCFSLILKRL